MPRKEKSRSFWNQTFSFPQNFTYEVEAPLNTVVQHIAEMEKEPALFQYGRNVSVIPTGQDYHFRVQGQRYGTMTTTIEGRVWQDEAGCTVIEGETRSHGWSVILSMIVISLIGVLVSVTMMPAVSRLIIMIPFFAMVLFGMAISAGMYWLDRRAMTRALNEMIESIPQASVSAKSRRFSALELKDETEAEGETDLSVLAQKQEARR